MTGLEGPMQLNIAVLTNRALFNELILDMDIGDFSLFDGHFAVSEPRTTEIERRRERRTKGSNLTAQRLRSREQLQPRRKARYHFRVSCTLNLHYVSEFDMIRHHRQ